MFSYMCKTAKVKLTEAEMKLLFIGLSSTLVVVSGDEECMVGVP